MEHDPCIGVVYTDYQKFGVDNSMRSTSKKAIEQPVKC